MELHSPRFGLNAPRRLRHILASLVILLASTCSESNQASRRVCNWLGRQHSGKVQLAGNIFRTINLLHHTLSDGLNYSHFSPWCPSTINL